MTSSDRNKSIVLLSGGLDSTVAFKKILDSADIILALTFNYGQRAVTMEIKAAKAISKRFNIEHQVIDLPWLRDITKTALVKKDQELPMLKTDELDEMSKIGESAKNVWVPNRNGAFINIAASFCDAYEADYIVTGFNAEEAVTFPDNSTDFIEAINKSLTYSTKYNVSLISPTAALTKEEIVKEAILIDAPLDLIWSCYEGGEKMCGSCESCLRLRRALEAENIDLADKLFN